MKTFMSDIKMYLLNATYLVVSFSHLEMALKIVLGILTVGYTAQKWYLLDKARRNDNKKK
mgnify:FL=1|jgi:hypothetical protein|tara:strand:- start:4356 stop:4535 length:180 start_codon:yes stop_codon:yes gene_type:complete